MTPLQRWSPLFLPPLAVLGATNLDLRRVPALPVWFWVLLVALTAVWLHFQPTQWRQRQHLRRLRLGLIFGSYMAMLTLLINALKPGLAWGSAAFMGLVFGVFMAAIFTPMLSARQEHREQS